MGYQELRKTNKYTAYGYVIDGREIISILSVMNPDGSAVVFQMMFNGLDFKRKLKNWFRKPTWEQAQENWINDCIAAAKEYKNGR